MTTNTMKAAMMKAAAAKAKTATPQAAVEPLQVITGGTRINTRGKEVEDRWFSSRLAALVERVSDGDLTKATKAAEGMVATGMVRVPDGWSVRAIWIKRYGTMGVVVDPPGAAKGKGDLAGIEAALRAYLAKA